MTAARASGILCHPTSLPSPFGIGDLGPESRKFVDFLVNSGQSCWQILPLGPIGYGNSPYMSFSAFAGNTLLISPQILVDEGLLDVNDISDLPSFKQDRVEYGPVIKYKTHLLYRSFQRFKTRHSCALSHDYYLFIEENNDWLEDFALFMALKERHSYHMWTEWETGLAQRERGALENGRNELSDDIHFYKYCQYIFFKQWKSLKKYCNNRGISIIGDMPLYLALDSADVWTNRDIFDLDEKGDPRVIAGVPPDYFSAVGQRWGNPIYRWDVMARNGYQWWIKRFKLGYQLCDILRLDHFRGYEAYWEIPADQPFATTGKWEKGPGAELFKALQSSLGDIRVIAEDLGVITPEVEELREVFHFPGMRILQMAFGNDPKAGDYRPHNYTVNCVVYTASHDHNTTVGWFTAEPGTQSTQSAEEIESERKYCLDYLGTDGKEINWDLIRLAMSSVANTAIFPLQDILGLDTLSRMNLPGTTEGNWEWRMQPGMLDLPVIDRLKKITRIYERGR
ncbi:MAG: 4-alpha-glucanotransferase [Dehalococcoidales bacterium]|nr:4-alpha-glucanotransferase [Dehalococcoidales bacterium]